MIDDILLLSAAIENGQRMVDGFLEEIEVQITKNSTQLHTLQVLYELKQKIETWRSRPETRKAAKRLTPF